MKGVQVAISKMLDEWLKYITICPRPCLIIITKINAKCIFKFESSDSNGTSKWQITEQEVQWGELIRSI